MRSLLLILMILIACTKKNDANITEEKKVVEISKEDKELLTDAQDIFGVLKKYQSKNPALVELGKKLYLNANLSKNGKISCNSCHRLDNFGVDNEKTSPGHDGTRGDRNSPSSFNAADNVAQFWDGRASDLAEQALGPLLNPIEHGLASKEEVLEKLKTKEYVDLFTKAFKGKESISFENVGVAIAEFEKTLVTPSRFDEYLGGNIHALSSEERKGLGKFMELGCTSCHTGKNFGGMDFQQLGLIEPYPIKDLGRYMITKKESDKFVFKVPNLRNIEKTYPYFHDGSVETLEEAIRIMGKHQLGEELTSEDIKSIKTFLLSLTGEL